MSEAKKKDFFYVQKMRISSAYGDYSLEICMMNYYHGISALSLFAFAPYIVDDPCFSIRMYSLFFCMTKPNKTRNK